MRVIAIIFVLCTISAAGQNPPSTNAVNSAPAQTAAQGSSQAAEDPGARKAKGLITKMVQALGGQAYLTMQDMQQSGRTYGFYHGEPAGAGAPYWDFWKWPDKERIELLKHHDWILIHNGDQGYDITFRGTVPEEKDQLEDYLRRRHYSMQQVLRVWLNKPDTVYFYEGQAAAERKPALQVSVMNAQNEGVTFYIDQNTFLPIKKTFVWRDAKTRDRTEESEIYDNYRMVQGIMTPFSVTRQKNGWSTNQRFINDIKYNQNLADPLFSATVGAPASGQATRK